MIAMGRRGKKYSTVLATACSIAFAENVLISALAPFFPGHAKEHYGLSPLLVGMILGAFPFVNMITSPLIGILCNKGRSGHWVLLRSGIILLTVSTLLFGFASSFTAFLLTRSAQGLSSACINVGYLSLLTSGSPPGDGLIKAFAAVEVATGLGYILGPPIGASVFTAVGMKATFALFAFLPFAVLLSLMAFDCLNLSKISQSAPDASSKEPSLGLEESRGENDLSEPLLLNHGPEEWRGNTGIKTFVLNGRKKRSKSNVSSVECHECCDSQDNKKAKLIDISQHPGTETHPHLLPKPHALWILYFVSLSSMVSVSFIDPTIAKHFRLLLGCSVTETGLLYGFPSLLYTVGAVVVPKLVSKYGECRTISAGFFLVGVAYILIGPSPALALLYTSRTAVWANLIVTLVVLGCGWTLALMPILPLMQKVVTARAKQGNKGSRESFAVSCGTDRTSSRENSFASSSTAMPRPLTGVQSNSDLASVYTFAMAGTRQRVRSTASSTTSAAPPKLPVLAFPLLSGTVVGNGHDHQQTGLALNDGLEVENGGIEKEEEIEEDEENAAAALYASSCSAGEFLGPILGGLAVQLLPRSKELTCSDVPVSLCLYAFPWAATTLGIFNIVMAILLWLVLPSLTGIQRTTASSYEKLHKENIRWDQCHPITL